MRQGEIWNANLNLSKGSEQAGFRPEMILSGNLLNQHLNVVIVAPLTTQIKKYKTNPILNPIKSNGLNRDSELLTFHIRSLSKDQVVNKIGQAESDHLDRAIKTLHDILKY